MPDAVSSKMRKEALEAPTVVERLLKENRREVESLAGYLRRNPPPFALTVARGSSDHAALFGKYLFESLLNIVTASAAPSVFTVYDAVPRVSRALVAAISQSGESPDLLEVVQTAKRSGALTLALVNQPQAPLAKLCEAALPLWAGVEESVAATKSYLAALAALAQLAAQWKQDKALISALEQLPEAMQRASEADWTEGLEALHETENTLVVGRGYAFAIASELALKLKETSALHAEALSGAELLHGPVALVEPGFPLLLLAPKDRPLESIIALAENLKTKGAHLLIASSEPSALGLAHTPLPLPVKLHPVLDGILLAQAFYPFAAQLAKARGLDPDRPRNLAKVTRTR